MTKVSEARDERAAIDKAFSLLVSFGSQAAAGIGVSELARRAELSKSTAFRVLKMLERNGAVERVGSDYRFGQRLADLGTSVYAPDHDVIRDVMTPFLADLYESTHETVHLATLHGTDVVYLAKLFGHRRPLLPSRVGGRVPANCTAVGKVMMAYDSASYDALVATPLVALTDDSITDADDLTAQLVRIRRERIAFEVGESAVGVSCVAVPVFGVGGTPVAGLSVSGATGSLDTHQQAGALRRVGHDASRLLRRAGVGSSVRRTGRVAS